jgi:hypothetical protein
MLEVWNDAAQANFKKTMQMSWLASIHDNMAFLILSIIRFNRAT